MLSTLKDFVCERESRLVSDLKGINGEITQMGIQLMELAELRIKLTTACDNRDNVR